jgi:hypothetical protein
VKLIQRKLTLDGLWKKRRKLKEQKAKQ